MSSGRPTKYKTEYAEQARKLCQLGATDDDLSDFFEVSRSTINLWKVKNKAFSDALKLGKDPADDKVERALFHRAVGYSHPEDDIRVVNGEIVVTPTMRHYPPDSTACIFWLKNRRPDEWRANPDGQGGEDLAASLSKLIEKLPS